MRMVNKLTSRSCVVTVANSSIKQHNQYTSVLASL